MIKLNTIIKRYKTVSTTCIGILALAASSFACSESENKLLDNKTLNELFGQLANNNDHTQKIVELNKHLRFITTLEGTTKGNGTLKIHNLNLRLFDQHDDGIVYEGGSLKFDLKDLNENKRKELIITGIIKYTGDDESGPSTYKPLTLIYTYDCKAGIFKNMYKNSEYSIELAVEKVEPLKCN